MQSSNKTNSSSPTGSKAVNHNGTGATGLALRQCKLPIVEDASFGSPEGARRGGSGECYALFMYAQKFRVDVVIRGQQKPCPLDWLDQFCMRNFTNAAEFDDTLPTAEGQVETSFQLSGERFAQGLAAWLTQRGKGEGEPVKVHVTKI
jgi:hypothetical protein